MCRCCKRRKIPPTTPHAPPVGVNSLTYVRLHVLHDVSHLLEVPHEVPLPVKELAEHLQHAHARLNLAGHTDKHTKKGVTKADHSRHSVAGGVDKRDRRTRHQKHLMC